MVHESEKYEKIQKELLIFQTCQTHQCNAPILHIATLNYALYFQNQNSYFAPVDIKTM